MDRVLRMTLGVILIISLLVLLVSLIWLIINAIRHRKTKKLAIISGSSFVLSGVIIFSLLYFWVAVGDYTITRSDYNDYSSLADNVNVLYNSDKHADSISYSKKVTSSKKAIKEVVNTDVKLTDSKRTANTEKIFYSMLNYAVDDSDYTENQKPDISEYGKAILDNHISMNKSYSLAKKAAVKNYFSSKIN